MHCVAFLDISHGLPGSTVPVFVYVELSTQEAMGYAQDREVLCFSDGNVCVGNSGEMLIHQAKLSDLDRIETEDAYYARMRKVVL